MKHPRRLKRWELVHMALIKTLGGGIQNRVFDPNGVVKVAKYREGRPRYCQALSLPTSDWRHATPPRAGTVLVLNKVVGSQHESDFKLFASCR